MFTLRKFDTGHCLKSWAVVQSQYCMNKAIYSVCLPLNWTGLSFTSDRIMAHWKTHPHTLLFCTSPVPGMIHPSNITSTGVQFGPASMQCQQGEVRYGSIRAVFSGWEDPDCVISWSKAVVNRRLWKAASANCLCAVSQSCFVLSSSASLPWKPAVKTAQSRSPCSGEQWNICVLRERNEGGTAGESGEGGPSVPPVRPSRSTVTSAGGWLHKVSTHTQSRSDEFALHAL